MTFARVIRSSFVAVSLAFRGVAAAECGDGTVDAGEQCDFGPDRAGDCCDATCAAVADATACGAGGQCAAAVCDSPLRLSFARVRPQLPPGSSRGSIVLRAEFPTAPSDDVFGIPDGATVEVRDAASLDHTAVWPASFCSQGTRGGWLCKTPLPTQKIRADRIRGTDTWRFTIRLKSLPLDGPFQPPFSVRLTTGSGFDRTGEIGSGCATATNGAVTCRVILQ